MTVRDEAEIRVRLVELALARHERDEAALALAAKLIEIVEGRIEISPEKPAPRPCRPTQRARKSDAGARSSSGNGVYLTPREREALDAICRLARDGVPPTVKAVVATSNIGLTTLQNYLFPRLRQKKCIAPLPRRGRRVPVVYAPLRDPDGRPWRGPKPEAPEDTGRDGVPVQHYEPGGIERLVQISIEKSGRTAELASRRAGDARPWLVDGRAVSWREALDIANEWRARAGLSLLAAPRGVVP